MQRDIQHLRELIGRLTESLSVEIKDWLDVDRPEALAKIVKAALALRNYNGGYLFIGFDDRNHSPTKYNLSTDVRSAFHPDKIQGAIAKYASDPFSVDVEFVERENQQHPVIVVPSGVKSVVAAKSDLIVDGKKLIAVDDVYVRSLSSNNTPSTTKAGWKDWSSIVEVCFDNREADVARFIRRHLPNLEALLSSGLLPHLENATDTKKLRVRLQDLLDAGVKRCNEVLKRRAARLPSYGTWEVALIVGDGRLSYSANDAFLKLLSASNPQFTGWPIWLDSRSFRNKSDRPYVFDKAWEALIIDYPSDWGIGHLDFMRVDPVGQFYLLRAFQDDLGTGPTHPKPATVLDFGLPVVRTAEALGVGLAFAKALGTGPSSTTLGFGFRWSGLEGRQLTSWAQRDRYLSGERTAAQDTVISIVELPSDTATSSLGQYVVQAVQPLFEVFEGFELSEKVIEDLTQRLLQRRL